MFYPECDHCVVKYPELEKEIMEIDNQLHFLDKNSIIFPNLLAKKINRKISHIETILEELSIDGLLGKEFYFICPICGDHVSIIEYFECLENEDKIECPICFLDLSCLEMDQIRLFRIINSNQIRLNQKDKDKMDLESHEKDLNKEIINSNVYENAHLLRYYSDDDRIKKRQPFAGKILLIILHLLSDLMPFTECLKSMGLDMNNAYFLYKEYPYTHKKEEIIYWLSSQGSTVKPREELNSILQKLSNNTFIEPKSILIIEDGGFIVPEIHKNFSNLLPLVIGAVEQTTRGIMNAEEISDIQIPIISVATSKLKSEFEPDYIGKAVVDNIQKMLTDISLKGKKVAIFGYGTIGKSIAEWFQKNHTIVTIYEPDLQKSLSARQKGFIVAENIKEASKDKFLIIGSSGRTSIDSDVISYIDHKTYIASASSERYEIDFSELEKIKSNSKEYKNSKGDIIGTEYNVRPNDRVIILLANGYPINFWGFESMPNEASDLIMSLILLCACELSMNKDNQPGINSDFVNKTADKYELPKIFTRIHFHQ
jgi:S-adenosylhomocysteine hydrolase